MSDFRFIRYLADYDVVRLVLSRPPLNVLTVEMMREVAAALDEAAGRPGLKALVLSAEGKAFSTGVAVEEHVGNRTKEMLETFHGLFRRLHALDCVTLAAVRGAALGGGAELATFCDVVLAAEDATFGQPEITLGVFAPIAALHYPRRIGTGRTLALLLSGEVIGAAEAERIGLVDRVVPADRLADAVESRLARFRGQSAPVLRLTKRAVREAAGAPFEVALPSLEDLYHYELMATEDAAEGLRAFLERRKPVWKDC
ncbi:MAG TPA: enoyl-CoA hydratase/isomerase family protein [Methylomirabilota bacterium]|nr:enoyl-CoA hydratase/isomerase family protein [Methylomirabilota bacterium]